MSEGLIQEGTPDPFETRRDKLFERIAELRTLANLTKDNELHTLLNNLHANVDHAPHNEAGKQALKDAEEELDDIDKIIDDLAHDPKDDDFF